MLAGLYNPAFMNFYYLPLSALLAGSFIIYSKTTVLFIRFHYADFHLIIFRFVLAVNVK